MTAVERGAELPERKFRLNVAIVGAGKMGRLRARACEALGAHVGYVCDRDLRVAESLASELVSSPIVLTQPSALDWRRFDTVFVCTPPSEREAALLAATNRVAFLVEKPLGLSLKDCVPLLELLRQQPVLGAVGYMNRYRESVRHAKQQLAGDELLGISCHWVGKPYAVPWWSRHEQSGGPINEQATHLVDLVRHITSQEVVEVQGLAPSAKNDAAPTYGFVMRLAGGPICTLLYSSGALCKSIEMNLFGRLGPVSLRGSDFQLVRPGTTASEAEAQQQVFTREVACFFRALADGEASAVLSSVADAAKTQSVVDALQRAAKSGRAEHVNAVLAEC